MEPTGPTALLRRLRHAVTFWALLALAAAVCGLAFLVRSGDARTAAVVPFCFAAAFGYLAFHVARTVATAQQLIRPIGPTG